LEVLIFQSFTPKQVLVRPSEKSKLCKSLESLVIRDRLIGTREQNLTSRINNASILNLRLKITYPDTSQS
jgi:hypothetical protein